MKHEVTAKRLKYAMDLNRIKASELSQRAGVSKASVSQYVNGTHAPGNINAGKMSVVLGVNPVWLMGFEAPMIAPPKDSKEPTMIVELFNRMDDQQKVRLLSYADFLLGRGE